MEAQWMVCAYQRMGVGLVAMVSAVPLSCWLEAYLSGAVLLADGLVHVTGIYSLVFSG